MTKKEAKANKAAWNLALAEKRVVNFDGMTMRSYLTAEEATKAAADANAAGMPAKVVDIEAINAALKNLGCEPNA